MKASKKRYDGKHKVTRIFLADYQLLKELSARAGVSMAECLHQLITRQQKLARQTPVTIEPSAQPAFGVSVPIPLRARPQPTFRARAQPTITTNGSKVTAFRIKTKGIRRE